MAGENTNTSFIGHLVGPILVSITRAQQHKEKIPHHLVFELN